MRYLRSVLFAVVLAGVSGSLLVGSAQALSFSPATGFGAVSGPISATSADFSGDGKADLASASSSGTSTVSVLLGDGTGAFGPASTFSTGTGSYSVAIADLNGDSFPDLAVDFRRDGGASVARGESREPGRLRILALYPRSSTMPMRSQPRR